MLLWEDDGLRGFLQYLAGKKPLLTRDEPPIDERYNLGVLFVRYRLRNIISIFHLFAPKGVRDQSNNKLMQNIFLNV